MCASECECDDDRDSLLERPQRRAVLVVMVVRVVVMVVRVVVVVVVDFNL